MKNGVLFQYFEWNLPDDGQLWNQLARDASHLKSKGITAVWIPPAYKGSQRNDVGYSAYDLYDFGEFDQKGTVRTKYGTRQELQNAIEALHDQGIEVYLDAVLNQKLGGDTSEKFPAVPVARDNRLQDIGPERTIEAYTGFDFKGRKGRYSRFKWHWYHFSGVDYDKLTGDNEVFRVVGPGKGWSQGVDKENANYDYLMGCDVDYNNPEVVGQTLKWGRWAIKQFGFDGFRMDALKHIDSVFSSRFMASMRKTAGKDFYFVSEYWSQELSTLVGFLKSVGNRTDLFDVPLHFNFYQAALQGADYDMRTIFDNTLVRYDSRLAVTFVDNHDSQPSSSLSSDVGDWFKPMAYGLILLMREGYPTVFYGDYYSISHPESDHEKRLAGKGELGATVDAGEVREASPHRRIIDILLDARSRYAYGDQDLYFDHPNTVGLVRHGDAEHPGSGLALLVSNGDDGFKRMVLGSERVGEVWHEITGSIPDTVTLDKDGAATFTVKGRNLAVWVRRD